MKGRTRPTRVLVVTDINGKPCQTHCLSHHLALDARSVRTVALCELLGTRSTGEDLHGLLVETGGVDQAVARLKEMVSCADVAIGYSAGGMVLWQSVLLGLKINFLVCISSTRLRLVNAGSVPVPTIAVFGDRDKHRPHTSWADGSSVTMKTIAGADHDFNAHFGTARDLCLATISAWMEGSVV